VKLKEIVELAQGSILTRKAAPDLEISSCGASDLMSDVLANVKADSLLITGLANTQSVRTAEMADIRVLVYVRGKVPDPETVSLAEESGIPLIVSPLGMYEMCGRLYQAGLVPVRRLHQKQVMPG
jgi:citrate lyase beta subunit